MKKTYDMQRFIEISEIVIKAISLLFVAIFLFVEFLPGGHEEIAHFMFHDYILFAFVPLLYIIGVFVYFNNEFINGTVIFVSFLGYNLTLAIAKNTPLYEMENAFLLIPAVLFILLYTIKRYEEARKAELTLIYGNYEELQQNYKIVEAMHEITTEMLKDNDLDSILQLILEKAVDIVPKAQTGSILVRNGDRMEFRATVGYNLDVLKKIELNFQDMYQYKLNSLYEPTVIRDIRTFNSSNLDPKTTKNLEDGDALIAKSVLTCSIMFKDEIYGFINLDNIEDVEAFQEKDKTFIKHLAQQIEAAVKNQKMVEDIYKLSRYDALTGAYTRTYHTSLMKDVYEKAKKTRQVFSICNLDINELKQVNDKYGHDAGDQYIIYFSNIIKQQLDDQAIFTRMGGDEFLIVYKSCDRKCAQDKIAKMRKAFKKDPFTINSTKLDLTFGCGISTFIEDSEDLEKLLIVADQRMYENKFDIK